MKKTHIAEINKIILKHSYTISNIDFESMLNELLELFNILEKEISESQKREYYDNFISILFNICLHLSKKNINKYIKLLKKKNIYIYQRKFFHKFFMKFFLKTYIIFYFLKQKKYIFFQNYITFMPKKAKMRIGLLVWKLFIWKKNENIFQRLKTILPGKLYIDYLELVVTTKCTLKCKHCANLMPMYSTPYNVDKDTIIKSINKLKSCVDGIYVFRILGGEPFCNPDLKYYLKELPKDIIKEIVIVTNGTLVPNDLELINIMKSKDVIVNISNYGKHSYKKEELINLLKNENIRYKIEDNYIAWYDFGTLENKNRNTNILKQQFAACDRHCKSILNGSIYYCPRSGHGIDLGKIKKIDGEYVDLLNNTDKVNKKQLKKLTFRNTYIEACNYCDYATKDCKIIPIGE